MRYVLLIQYSCNLLSVSTKKLDKEGKLVAVRTECFGYRFGQCEILTELVCKQGTCKFFKERAQYVRELHQRRNGLLKRGKEDVGKGQVMR